MDIQLMILREVSDIECLAHLVMASPSFCRVFSDHRENILSRVVYLTYGAELWPDAVAAVRAEMLPQGSLTRVQRLDYVREYHRFQNETHYPPVDIDTTKGLCRLYWTVRYHVKHFAERSISFLADCAKTPVYPGGPERSKGTAVTSALSAAEKTRLYRAFFRFQMYARFFYNVTTDKDEKRALFASKLLPWEVEEIASVYSYVTRRIQDKYDEAGDEYLDTLAIERHLAAAVGGVGDPFEMERSRTHNSNLLRLAARQYDARLAGDIARKPLVGSLEFSEPKTGLYEARLKAYLVSSGLCHLRRLFESSGDERSCMVSAFDDFGSFQTPSLNKMIDYALTRRRLLFIPATILDELPSNEPQTTEDSNSAWIWAHAGSTEKWGCGFYHDLRDWGYVFWDDSRVRTAGIFEQKYVIFFLLDSPSY